MSDNTLQFEWIVTIKEGHEDLFRDDDNVFVAGDLLWYPVEGHPEIRSAPDTLAAFGRPKGYRGSYMQWREGNVAPQVVWEVLSPGNYPAQLREKFNFYQLHGVEEYYQYDPDRGRLRGWVRQGDALVEIPNIQGWKSPRTGVSMEIIDGELVLTRPDGEKFLSYPQLAQRRREAEARAAREHQRAEQERQQREQAQSQAEQERREREAAQAEVEMARQQAAQERQQREAARAEAERERQQRQAAEQRGEQERQRAERLAARLRELGIDPEAGA
jgi:Uma2 family endonuclease